MSKFEVEKLYSALFTLQSIEVHMFMDMKGCIWLGAIVEGRSDEAATIEKVSG